MDTSKTAALRQRLGGFLKGICHPDTNYTLLKNAGFGWVRRDVPFPVDENGAVLPQHRDFLAQTKAYAENGLRSVAFCCISTGVFRFPGARAAEIAVQSQKISTTLLQRKMHIGFGRAASIIDDLEEMGVW